MAWAVAPRGDTFVGCSTYIAAIRRPPSIQRAVRRGTASNTLRVLDLHEIPRSYVLVLTPDGNGVRSAPEAAALAGVTYRQLDYWTRKGWIVPAALDRVSAGRVVRRYGTPEILRCAVLSHLGRSGLDVAAYGPRLKELQLGSDEMLVVGPHEDLKVIPASQLRSYMRSPGRYVVFDSAPLLARLQTAEPPARDLAPTRRTA